MSVETRTERTSGGAPPARAQARIARLRPKLGLVDTLLQLWRAKWLMFLVFVPVALVGFAATLLTPTKYPASARLLVRVSQDYVFSPVSGEVARMAPPAHAEVLAAEAELARSGAVAERVIGAIGLSHLYPGLAARELRARTDADYEASEEALATFARDLSVTTAPSSPILQLSYSHRDPQLAAATLNRVVSEYLKYRQEILSGQQIAGLSAQRAAIEDRLAVADGQLRDFLQANGLSDFEAEMFAMRNLLAGIADETVKAEAARSEAEARVASLTRQLASTPKQVDLYADSAGGDASPSAVRRGLNPTWQALDADRSARTADLNALAGRLATLARQKQEAGGRIATLAALEPDYLRLKRERDALEASADAFAGREQAERARSELAARSVESISVYEAARPPAQSDDTRRAIILTTAIVGLLAALMAGLMRAWSSRGFATAGSLERTLGLTVIATARDRST